MGTVHEGSFQKGEKHRDAKVTDADCARMREKRKAGASLKTLAEEFGIATSQASRICTNQVRRAG